MIINMLIKPNELRGDRFEIVGSEREKAKLEFEFPQKRICNLRIAGKNRPLLRGRPKFTLKDAIKKVIILVLVDQNNKPISLSILVENNPEECYYILE